MGPGRDRAEAERLNGCKGICHLSQQALMDGRLTLTSVLTLKVTSVKQAMLSLHFQKPFKALNHLLFSRPFCLKDP